MAKPEQEYLRHVVRGKDGKVSHYIQVGVAKQKRNTEYLGKGKLQPTLRRQPGNRLSSFHIKRGVKGRTLGRSVEVFQTAIDVENVTSHLFEKSNGSLIALDYSRSDEGIREIALADLDKYYTFLITLKSFSGDIVLRNLDDGRKLIAITESSIVVVERSRLVNNSFRRGRYYFDTTRLATDSGVQKLINKPEPFLSWGDGVLHYVRKLGEYRVTYGKYKYYFLEDAAKWIDGQDGEWDIQSGFVLKHRPRES